MEVVPDCFADDVGSGHTVAFGACCDLVVELGVETMLGRVVPPDSPFIRSAFPLVRALLYCSGEPAAQAE